MSAALGCGLLIAVFYDIYWLLIACRKRSLRCRAIQDILFWLSAFFLIASLWIYVTGGMMRLYVYLWLAAGIIIFRRLLSPFLHRLRPRQQAPAAACRPPAPTGKAAPPWLHKAVALPERAMLQAGRCFWLGAARLYAHLPKKPPPPA